MEIDFLKNEQDRPQRDASVISGMSLEDMEAAETLNSLHASMCFVRLPYATTSAN